MQHAAWQASHPLLLPLCCNLQTLIVGHDCPSSCTCKQRSFSKWRFSPKLIALQELSADIANFGSQKEQRTKAAQGKLKAAKAALEGSKKAAREGSQKLAQAVAEAEAAASERQSLTEQLQAALTALQGTQQALCAQHVLKANLLACIC